ncbi:MAG: type II toxin-antitoxin system VapC family toxin [Polyangiaceae bacterium]|nr:type II toxin-antitoxin system VapC family toxin [Polyangiaceae bacterium]
MTALCLDTSAYSHFKRGDEPAVEAIAWTRRIAVPVVVLGELRAGFAAGKRSSINERELRAFLSNPVVEVLDVDEPASAIYAEIVQQLKRAGTPLPSNDIWIAALAAREGLPVLTYDAHFQAIPRVGVRLLEEQERD